MPNEPSPLAFDSFFIYDDDRYGVVGGDDDDDDVDGNDCYDCDLRAINEYDEDYYEDVSENLTEVYSYCLVPSISDTAKYLFPIVLSSIIFRLCAQNRYVTPRIFHCLSAAIGAWVVHSYVRECFYTLLYFSAISYACLYLPKVYRGGVKTFLPGALIILYCEYYMSPAEWHKIRGIVMIATMRSVSLAKDFPRSDAIPSIIQYLGYIFGAATSLFGPWISFKDYSELCMGKCRSNFRWILDGAKYLLASFVFLSISNCWTRWMFTDRGGKWLRAYGDALAFRSSHYFIAHATSSILIFGGYPTYEATIVKPFEIELPRSLVQVVVSWNVPMHTWLKLYIFRPARRRFGKFSAVALTYIASSFLHGLNFQLAAVLLSLGFYTYIEHRLRSLLAETFDACIAAKRCPNDGTTCSHENKSNSWWVLATNFSFSILAVFHLSYLGLTFDSSDTQETGYSYEHAIKKWSDLGFTSHWVALATYLTYFLLR